MDLFIQWRIHQICFWFLAWMRQYFHTLHYEFRCNHIYNSLPNFHGHSHSMQSENSHEDKKLAMWIWRVDQQEATCFESDFFVSYTLYMAYLLHYRQWTFCACNILPKCRLCGHTLASHKFENHSPIDYLNYIIVTLLNEKSFILCNLILIICFSVLLLAAVFALKKALLLTNTLVDCNWVWYSTGVT